jgi:hypothetical protein
MIPALCQNFEAIQGHPNSKLRSKRCSGSTTKVVTPNENSTNRFGVSAAAV